jgi:predicted nucleotidyltransferase
MIIDENVEKALKNIFEITKPISIFIYGSRARNDFKANSDYEVGALFLKENKPRRSEIAKLHNIEGMNVYPFTMEDLEKYNLDTPFPKAIYLRELIGSAKTVFGEKILENMEAPEIKLTDLLERAAFDVATAFAAFRSFKTNDLVTTSINFKSALFGVRVLEILELKKFPFTYDEIFELSEKLNLSPEYRALIEHAYKARKGAKIEEQFLYTNISFLNQEVLAKIKHQILEFGDKVILEGKKIEW